MTPFLLVSRSAEYEARLRGLLGERLKVVPGEFLAFGPDAVLDRVGARPRVAVLGPLLNYEETRSLIQGLTERNPHIGLVVVREQRSDLEDWVDELALHAVLSPGSTDAETSALLDRLMEWLITSGRASANDFDAMAPVDAAAPVPLSMELAGASPAMVAQTIDADAEFASIVSELETFEPEHELAAEAESE